MAVELHNAHVIDWLWWEFKKDKAWYYFPIREDAVMPVFNFNTLS